MVRAPCCDKMGLNKGSWTEEEDQILINHVQRYGRSNWRALPKQAAQPDEDLGRKRPNKLLSRVRPNRVKNDEIRGKNETSDTVRDHAEHQLDILKSLGRPNELSQQVRSQSSYVAKVVGRQRPSRKPPYLGLLRTTESRDKDLRPNEEDNIDNTVKNDEECQQVSHRSLE